MDVKQSFDPILDPETTILILGTMPSDKSLALAEYYGNPRNRFWKIIATLTNNESPLTYSDKKELLAITGMAFGTWYAKPAARAVWTVPLKTKNPMIWIIL